MKKSLIGLGVLSSLFITSLSPVLVNAGDHSNYGYTMKKKVKDNFTEYLIAHGYYTQSSNMKDRRMGIMRFQKEMGLRQTGSLNIQTRVAIRKAMNMPNIVETAVATPSLSTLVTAVTAGGLGDTLTNGGPFTVFAPTNDAFAKIPADTLNSLLTPEKKSDLVSILTYHVVSGKAFSSGLVDGQEITTLQGKTLKVRITDGKVYINNAQVVMADVKTKNGVVHVIDSVLLP